eukprot:scaffold14366_cov208-Ochromonas_danica.AAC.10
MDKTRQLGQKILVTLKEIPKHFPKTKTALLEAPDEILSTAVKTGTKSLKIVIGSKVVMAVGAAAIAATTAKASADPPTAATAPVTVPDTVPVISATTSNSPPPTSQPNTSALSVFSYHDIAKGGGKKIYNRELARLYAENAMKATIAKFPHVQAAIKEVENGSINLLIELTYVSQPAATSPTTATTSDNSLDWASIVEDFANSFAQAFYEEGCKQSLFDPIDYEAECEIELNSEVAQTKMLMIKKGWSVLLASCFLGYVEIVGSLLSDSSMDVNEVDEEGGWTALHFASSGGHDEVVKLLLADREVNMLGNEEETGVEIDSNLLINGRTPLHEACSEGFAEVVEVLLSDGRVDVNKEDMDGRSPLHEACSGGHVDVVKLLLSDARVVDVNKEDKYGSAPLHEACSGGNADVVKLLLSDARVDVNKEDR